MFRKIWIFCLFIASFTAAKAQTLQNERSYIEATGYAEKEMVPDEIYISITLSSDRKQSVEDQEKELRDRLRKLGIDLKDLSLSDEDAAYIRVNWLNKDVVAKKNYQLKLQDAATVSRVFQELGEMNIKDAGIAKTDYSKKEDLKKELRIAALKDAKAQAQYMLDAIGQTAGKPLYVHENITYPVPYENNFRMMKAAAAPAGDGAVDNPDYIAYKKMKFSSTVETKFEIR